jgi:4-diphosphocytidyl-2-C-methyl-D-erythritol kinase
VRTLTLRPPAKVNLTLHVGAREPSGFHEVRTVMQSIALADKLVVSGRRGPFAFGVTGHGVPDDRTNLVWRAAELLWRRSGRVGDPQNAHIHLTKTIPWGAGLGGGSANAAATLAALNVAWGLKHSRPDLAALGAELGSDVPFFFCGGTAIAVGRGTEVYPLVDAPRLGVVIIKPSFGVSTAEAYGWLDADCASRTAGGEEEDTRRTRRVDLDWPTGPLLLENDLQAPVARRHPAIADMVAACLAQGARAAVMTGSGSAVFGLFDGLAAARAARRLQRPDWLVIPTRTLNRREAGRQMGL